MMTTATDVTLQGNLLTSKATILKSVFINFLTKSIPLVLGFTCIPFIIKNLGNERFGILTLIWAIIGYSTVMDMGLGRALTQHVAAKIGENDTDNLPKTIYTSVVSAFVVASFAALILWFCAPIIVNELNVSLPIQNETVLTIRLMICSIPFLIGNIMTTGVFEAYQKFAFLNKMNWPIVISNFIAPFFILPFYNSLPAVVMAVLASRVLVFICLIASMSSVIPAFYKKSTFDLAKIKPLFGYSKWVALNSMFESAASLSDRFFVSVLMSASVVAFLTTPSFAITRFAGFLTSAVNVFFPAFSTEYVQNPVRCRRIYKKTFLTMSVAMAVPFLAITVFSKYMLTLWLGADFAQNAFASLSLYSAVFYVKSMGVFVQSFLDASGNMKTTFLINFATLPILLVAFYILINQYGIIGAPIALLIREIVCLLFKIIYSEKYFKIRLAGFIQVS